MLKLLKKIFHRKPEFGYVSDIDKFLDKYNQEHPEKSSSQVAEIAKHQRIFALRDKK